MRRRGWACAGLSPSAWACRLCSSRCAYEPQSNGSTENAARQFKGLLRTLLLALQERIQGAIL
eukprot:3936567-Alexandrium_andersonii.AAC.1